MKILIDILTPKQALLFSKLTEKLRKRGHQVYATTRRYREVLQLLRLKGIEATVVGEHGGGTLINKLRASARRTLELSSLFEAILPDLSISFSSPEMARASYGLKVPHICVNDSPHAEAVARLTIPLSDKLLTPKMIPKRAWTRFGISPEQIVQYYALDPWVWLKDFKPDKRILQELGLDESKPILTFRTEESFAAYLLGKTGKEVSIIPVIRNLLGKDIDLQIVVVPRYDEHISALRQIFGDEVFICETVVDGANLLYHTSVFIGAGGTMSAEAVLLGVPTISCYPGEPTIIEEYLVRRQLLTRETVPEKITLKILELLDDLEYNKKRLVEKVRRLTRNFEDPIEILTREVENLPK